MATRPLRTQARETPRTQGERIRFARLHIEISQDELAKRVRKISGGKVSKSLVSQWERDAINNPNNANILAIAAVTGVTPEWLINGKGPVLQTVASRQEAAPTDGAKLARAVRATMKAMKVSGVDANRAARIIGGLYDTLLDAPELDDSTLATFAATLARQ